MRNSNIWDAARGKETARNSKTPNQFLHWRLRPFQKTQKRERSFRGRAKLGDSSIRLLTWPRETCLETGSLNIRNINISFFFIYLLFPLFLSEVPWILFTFMQSIIKRTLTAKRYTILKRMHVKVSRFPSVQMLTIEVGNCLQWVLIYRQNQVVSSYLILNIFCFPLTYASQLPQKCVHRS